MQTRVKGKNAHVTDLRRFYRASLLWSSVSPCTAKPLETKYVRKKLWPAEYNFCYGAGMWASGTWGMTQFLLSMLPISWPITRATELSSHKGLVAYCQLQTREGSPEGYVYVSKTQQLSK